MRANRLSIVFCSLVSLPLVACGGDEGGGGGGVVVPDAKVFMDAAIDAPPACTIQPMAITEAPNAQNAAVIDFPAQGQKPAFLSFRMVWGPSEAEADWLEFDHNKPVALNMDLNLANGCQGGAYCLILLGNVTTAGGMLDSEQIFVARSGTIRITEAGNAGGNFKATITNAMFKRFEATANGLVDAMDATCNASIASMTIDLQVKAPMNLTSDVKHPASSSLSARTLRIQ